MVHVSNEKKQELSTLNKLVRQYKVIGVLDLSSYPSSELQKLKGKFREKMDVKVSKKSLMKIAFENGEKERKGISGLIMTLDLGIPALIFTNEDPFKLSKLLAKNKNNTFAKAGQVAPNDIVIQAGPTSFPPGPVIGELTSAGLKTAVEAGKIAIKEDKLFVRKGDAITAKQADVLSKLGIQPVEIGVRLIAMYEDGNVYDANVLDIDEAKYLNDLRKIIGEAFNLAINTEYITKETVTWLVKKAYVQSLAIDNKVNANGG